MNVHRDFMTILRIIDESLSFAGTLGKKMLHYLWRKRNRCRFFFLPIPSRCSVDSAESAIVTVVPMVSLKNFYLEKLAQRMTDPFYGSPNYPYIVSSVTC